MKNHFKEFWNSLSSSDKVWYRKVGIGWCLVFVFLIIVAIVACIYFEVTAWQPPPDSIYR